MSRCLALAVGQSAGIYLSYGDARIRVLLGKKAEKLRWPLRIAFALCLLTVLYLALDPAPLIKGVDMDKLNHVFAFFGLGLLLRWGWPQFRLLWAGLILLALGVLIEFLQQLTGRDAAFADVLADIVGLVLAAVAAYLLPLR